MTTPPFDIVDRIATVEEYRALRASVGWATPSRSQCQAALARSMFGVVAISNGAAVGMARIIGDDVLYATLVDVVVAQQFQHRGVGRRMMNRLVSWVTECGIVHVGVVAGDLVADYYEQWSFEPSGRYLRLRHGDPSP